MLDTEKKIKSIKGEKSIHYYPSEDPMDRGYVEAKYIEGLAAIGIADGFYSVQVFLPKRKGE
ncbi:hypothetical protein J6TS7_20970 [Paenibacillus dendritiformis]|uniref:hypothetical protein n=1 Tax=Paenibacillus TaxID=44249 RepID=UPI001B0DD9EC|nr:hypothetical protein [Paenibacillus dendritiformis]GIO78487.1 hypothetical protein J6TS7_20970 [Paenibacillus dendritiformis]